VHASYPTSFYIYLQWEYICSVFSNPQEASKDVFYSDRIARISWITPSHLEINPKSWNNDLWSAAVYGV